MLRRGSYAWDAASRAAKIAWRREAPPSGYLRAATPPGIANDVAGARLDVPIYASHGRTARQAVVVAGSADKSMGICSAIYNP